MLDYSFTKILKMVLLEDLGNISETIYAASPLLQYINIKTRSASRGSKSRGSFANLYAIYVLVEDYVQKNFDVTDTYKDYEGSRYSDLFERQRQLPFGRKLQNHALNNRLNEEFKKYFPTCNYYPIIRNISTSRYWFNENLLIVTVENNRYNLAKSVIKIIDEYINKKQNSFQIFIEDCERISSLPTLESIEAVELVLNLLAPNVDARLFEIVSYSILKYYYHDQAIFWGFERENLKQENLILYKTGRTNANDGGIDFVMKPLGRFFQVTETTDVKKYFLDIDKIQRYPITFVIKSNETPEELANKIKIQAEKQYIITTIVNQYMSSIEEIINVPILRDYFQECVAKNYLSNILQEIIKQSKVEFNY